MSVRAFVGLEDSYLQRLECYRIELERALHVAHGQHNVIKHMDSLFRYVCNTDRWIQTIWSRSIGHWGELTTQCFSSSFSISELTVLPCTAILEISSRYSGPLGV